MSARKTFLRGLGGSLIALPNLNLFSETNPNNSAPMRMVCVGTHFGFVPKLFFPENDGPNYKPSFLLEELQAIRQKFTVFSHLDHGVDAVGGHGGIHAFLSGVLSKNSKTMIEKNISVDQKAAQMVGAETRFPSLQLSTGGESSNSALSWNNSGVSMIPMSQLSSLYNQLFQATSKDNVSLSKKLNREKRSILDLARHDAKILNARVGKEDKETIDQYFTSIRDLEKKLIQDHDWIDRPKPKVAYSLKENVDQLNFIDKVPLFYDLIALALQSDSTRVISFMCSDIGKNLGGLPITKGYHQLTHHGQVESYIEELSIIEKYHCQQFYRFIQKLDDIKENNGKTLLDQCITLFGSGMGNASSHSNRNLPLLLAGGGFKHGQHINCKKANGKNDFANKLYVNMLQRFGMETDQFNNIKGSIQGLKV